MTYNELVHEVRQLHPSEKLRLIQTIAGELANTEWNEEGSTFYEVDLPIEAISAVHILEEVLRERKDTLHGD